MLAMIQERSDLGYSKVCNITLHKISIIDFFSKCDQILRKLWIWSHLMKKSLMENLIFGAVLCLMMKSVNL